MENSGSDFVSFLKINHPDLFNIIDNNPKKRKCIDEIDKMYEFFIQRAKYENAGFEYIFVMLFFIACGDDKSSFEENLLNNKELSDEFKSNLKRAYDQTPEYIREYCYHLLDGIGDDEQCD